MARKLTLEYVREYFKSQGCKLLTDVYVNAQTKMPYICNCGRKSEIHYSNFRRGQRCAQCAIEKRAEKRRLDFNTVTKEFSDAGFVLLAHTYKNTTTPMECICVCGNKTLKTLSHIREGKTCRKCYIERVSGKNARQYRHDRDDTERRKKRHDPEHKEWRKAVFERDDYTCQKCTKRGNGEINAHHILSYDIYESKRYVVENGITLCKKCHKEFHDSFGYGNNDFEQFMQWLIEDVNFPKEVALK